MGRPANRYRSRHELILQVERELLAMPEKRIQDEIDSIQITVYVFLQNQRAILDFLSWCEHDPANQDLMYLASKKKKEWVSRELTRLLHNYVASAKSLVDHTRGSCQRLYAPGDFPEYEAEIKRRFAKEPLVQFVQGLRNLLMHVRPPAVMFRFDIGDEFKTITRRLGLTRRDLDSWEGWTAPARAYLKAADDFLHLAEIIGGYAERMRDFYHWFDERQYELCGDEIERFRAKGVELAVLRLEHEIDTWLENPSETLGEDKLFSGLLDVSEIQAIQEQPVMSSGRVDKTLEMIGHYFDPPPSLVRKIRAWCGLPESDSGNGG